MKQMSLAAAADSIAGFERYRKPTRRHAFLAEVQMLMPLDLLVALIESVMCAVQVEQDKIGWPEELSDDEVETPDLR